MTYKPIIEFNDVFTIAKSDSTDFVNYIYKHLIDESCFHFSFLTKEVNFSFIKDGINICSISKKTNNKQNDLRTA